MSAPATTIAMMKPAAYSGQGESPLALYTYVHRAASGTTRKVFGTASNASVIALKRRQSLGAGEAIA